MNRSMPHNMPGNSDDNEIMYGLRGGKWLVSQVTQQQKKMTRAITCVP
jgi:hypothetical protein